MHIIQPLNFPTIGLTGLAMVVLLLAGCGGNESPISFQRPNQSSTSPPCRCFPVLPNVMPMLAPLHW